MMKYLCLVILIVSVIVFGFAACSQNIEQNGNKELDTLNPDQDLEQNRDNSDEAGGVEMGLSITSPDFQQNGMIPVKYTCQGDDVNPNLIIKGIPKGTKTLALIMDDPDAPMGTWDHWVMLNIPLVSQIEEDSVPKGAIQGKNSWEKNEYGGPCPPTGKHRYFFKLYALDTELDLDADSEKSDVEAAMEGHIIEQAELVGLFEKS